MCCWSEYYVCKGSEDEVNCKGHLTKLQALHYFQNANKSYSTKHKSIYLLSFLSERDQNIIPARGVKMKWITNTWHCPKQVEFLGLKRCWDLCSLIPHEIVKKCNKTQSCSWCNKTFFQERNSTNIKWYSMWKMWKTFERRDEISCAITYIECENWMFLRRTFTEYVLEHAKVNKKLQWMRENIFLGKNFINLQNIVATYLPRSLTGALHCPFCKICTAFNLKVSVST